MTAASLTCSGLAIYAAAIGKFWPQAVGFALLGIFIDVAAPRLLRLGKGLEYPSDE